MTNTELITKIMDYSKQGALMQPFILQAIAEFSKIVISRADELPDEGLVDAQAWVRCAKEAKEAIDDHLDLAHG